ncbi:phosphopantetheine-binding protein, partial [Streptomyces sp. NPDC090022]|uniref:phosphopantetheine-binding protein n=1 Tax=Streptomyces sp. NPDC090022 TaxID=3365920 RepID=UPI00382FDF9F
THMVPATLTPLTALPLTPNGKLDPTQLPAPRHLLTSAEYVAPRDDIEAELADLFGEVLGREAVGIHENFFDGGGDSLLAVRLMARLRRAFGVPLQVRALLDAPTVERLAVAVIEALAEAADPAELERMLAGPGAGAGHGHGPERTP